VDKRIIICISREYGSGGKAVGEKLAEMLGIKCYDKTLLKETALEHGVSEELIKSMDEHAAGWLSMGFPMGLRNPYTVDYYDSLYYNLNDKVFYMESETIRHIAAEGSCIIIGRVADEVLRNDPDMISVFIYAEKADRIKRIMKIENVDEEKAQQMIKKTDKNREHYYNFYSSKKWGKCDTYDLSISTSTFTINGAVNGIIQLLEQI